MEDIYIRTSIGYIRVPRLTYDGTFTNGNWYSSSDFYYSDGNDLLGSSGGPKFKNFTLVAYSDGATFTTCGRCSLLDSNGTAVGDLWFGQYSGSTPYFGMQVGSVALTLNTTNAYLDNKYCGLFLTEDNSGQWWWMSNRLLEQFYQQSDLDVDSLPSDGKLGTASIKDSASTMCSFNTTWNSNEYSNHWTAVKVNAFKVALATKDEVEASENPKPEARSLNSLYFYGRMRYVNTGDWVDSAPRIYSIAVYSGEDFPNNSQTLTDVSPSSIANSKYNIMTRIEEYGEQGIYRIYLTDNLNQDYFTFYGISDRSGGFNYHGVSYEAFTSVGNQQRLNVINDYNITGGTKTGSFYYNTLYNRYDIYGGPVLSETGAADLRALLALSPAQPSDPFSPGGTSEPGGGGGTFDDDDDEVGLDSKPTLSSADTGFVRIYNPTLSQVRSLAHYLFTNESWLQTAINHLKQYFESPIDAFILFNIVPCRVPDGGTDNFRVLFLDTGVQLTVAANQFVDVNCGDLVIDEYYGSALDYSPYTTISLYLPYIGNVDIDTDEVMGHTIRVAYRIDVVSGGCVAYVSRVDGSDDDQQERVLYQFSGHCAINIPFSQLDASSYISAMIQAATAVAVGVATGGAGAAAELGTEASVMTAGETAIASAGESTSLPPVMSMMPQIPVDLGLPRGSSRTPNIFEGLSPATMANTVGSVMGMKMHVQHAGGFSGNTGYLAKRRPYAIIKRPRMCNPDEYGSFNGYPSMMYERLGNLSGFTQVQQVQLTEIPCTAGEQAELMSLLKSGVIL